MGIVAKATTSLTVAGLTISSSIEREQESSDRIALDVPAGLAGSLTTRTDDNTGVVTLASGHGILTDDVVSIFWAGGFASAATVSGSTATTVTFDVDSGDTLPIATTSVVVSKKATHELLLNGDSLDMFAIKNTQRCCIAFLDDESAAALTYEIAEREGRFWVSGMGFVNPLAGESIESVSISNGSTTALTIDIGLLKSSD
jgi:hypothetical protein